MQDKVFYNGQIICEDNLISPGYVKLDRSGMITEVGGGSPHFGSDFDFIDLQDNYLAPGFLDIHTHGALGIDVIDGERGGLLKINQHKLSHGVTGFVSSLMTVTPDRLPPLLTHLCQEISNPDLENCLGFHLEGPFLSPVKRGIQCKQGLVSPSVEKCTEIIDILGKNLKQMTIAPELSGSKAVIDQLVKADVIPAAGHTDATYEEINRSFSWGISHGTHLFNGMRGVHHRNPGGVMALLDHPEVTVELIADGYHLHPSIINMVVKLIGHDRGILVSDSIRASGLPEGRHQVGSESVIVRDGKCITEDGRFAGSVVELNKSLNYLLSITQISIPKAVKCITINPAKVIGVDGERGSIASGKRGDLVVLTRELQVKDVYVKGELVR